MNPRIWSSSIPPPFSFEGGLSVQDTGGVCLASRCNKTMGAVIASHRYKMLKWCACAYTATIPIPGAPTPRPDGSQQSIVRDHSNLRMCRDSGTPQWAINTQAGESYRKGPENHQFAPLILGGRAKNRSRHFYNSSTVGSCGQGGATKLRALLVRPISTCSGGVSRQPYRYPDCRHPKPHGSERRQRAG